jgi:DNA recombination protein RmuC
MSLMSGVLLLVGLAAGAIFAWIVAGSRRGATAAALSQATGELAEKNQLLDAALARVSTAEIAKARLEEQLTAEKAALEQAKKSLSDTFASLAANALRENNQTFLDLANQKLGAQQRQADDELLKKETAIATMLKPVGEALNKLQATTHDLETKREGAYQAVLGAVTNVVDVSNRLGVGTRQLIEALRKPQVRGNWGQEQLERCIEFAGMVEHVSFDTEVAVRDGEISLRPDCVVHLPNQRTMVIDVKTPLEALLNATTCEAESERAAWLITHARNVRKHLDDLSSKSYWKQFSDSPEFVVCFLPSEAAFSAALDQDGTLIEYGSRANVILATPTTLIALLKAVSYGWQQMEITRNAVAIREAAQRLYEKLATAQDYFTKMGTALGNAVKHYNSLIGCVEGPRSIFSQARKLHELGIGQENLIEMPVLESVTRDLKADDWQTTSTGKMAEMAAVGDEAEPRGE